MNGKYRKLKKLRDAWEHPENYRLSPSEEKVFDQLVSFIRKAQAYNGKIICGDHGIGKTFTVRYFLSKMKLLDNQHYVEVNDFILKELEKRNIGLGLKTQLFKIVQKLIKGVEPITVLDACELLKFLDPNDFRTFIGRIHYSKRRTILVLPTELDPSMPTITIYLPTPSEEDQKIFLQNLETIEEIPPRPIPFTEMVKKVMM